MGFPLKALRPNDRHGVMAAFVVRALCVHWVDATDIPAQWADMLLAVEINSSFYTTAIRRGWHLTLTDRPSPLGLGLIRGTGFQGV